MSTPNACAPLSGGTAPGAISDPKPQLGRLVASTRSTIARWFARARQRRALRDIAERNEFHLLKDIGVSQEEALREANKPFWRR